MISADLYPLSFFELFKLHMLLQIPTSSPPPISLAQRQTIVAQRRTVIIQSAQEQLAEFAVKMEAKRIQVLQSLEQTHKELASQRARHWLHIVVAKHALQRMFDIVCNARKMKALSPERLVLILPKGCLFYKLLMYLLSSICTFHFNFAFILSLFILQTFAILIYPLVQVVCLLAITEMVQKYHIYPSKYR